MLNMLGGGMIVSAVRQISCNSVLIQTICPGNSGQMLV